MYNPLAALPFLAVVVTALSVPRSTQTFELTACGSHNGTIGRLIDGQVRLGGGLDQTTFSLSSNGSVYDVDGFGCVLTPEIGQFQCDQFASSTGGFAISSNGSFTSGGSSVFYACAASDTEYNIYVTPVANQLKCYEITLTTSGSCAASSSSTCSAVTQTVTVAATAAAAAPVTETITQTASQTTETITKAGSDSTETVYVTSTQAASQVIETITQAGSDTTETVTITTTAAGSDATETITVASTAAGSDITKTVTTTVSPVVASTITETQTVQVTDDITLSASTVYSTIFQTVTATQAASQVTDVETATVTQISTESYVQTLTTISSINITATEGNTSPTTIESSVEATTTTQVAVPTTTEATATTAETSEIASSTSSASTCVATTLTGSSTSGNYQYPHLIIPISSSTPTTAAGTQYFGTISSNTSTIFNFDIPSSYSGSTCNLVFLLPDHADLETSSYTETGSGQIEFAQLSSVATSATTYDNAPSVSADLGTFTITEGTSTLIKSFSCQAGETVAYEMTSVDDTYLYFFQDWNPSPLGLYITVC